MLRTVPATRASRCGSPLTPSLASSVAAYWSVPTGDRSSWLASWLNVSMRAFRSSIVAV
jgi:hypothetical protein